MSSLPIGSAHAWTEKAWGKAVEHQVEKQTIGYSFVGDGDNATIKQEHALDRGNGEQVVVKFSPTEDQDGISEGESVYDNAQKLNLFDDTLTINYLGFPYGLDSPMDQQRTSANLKRMLYYKASTQISRTFEEWIMSHFCGYTPANTRKINPLTGGSLKHAGHNTIVAPDAAHHIRAKDHATDELVAADTSAVLTLDAITEFEESAMSSAHLDFPMSPGQDGWYDMVIHPMHWRQLRDNSTAGEFQDIQLAAMKGGAKQKDTGLARGWMGVFSKTRIHVTDWITQGVKTSDGTAQANVRRAVFLGRCAGLIAYGKGYAAGGDEGSHFDWSEKNVEHKKWSLLVDTIAGFKTTRFNEQNYGCMVRSTYTPK